MEWEGMSALLLTEYFEDKQRLAEEKKKLDHLNNFVSTEYRNDLTEIKDKLEKEVKEIEKKIVEFISGLNTQQLKSIVYMSLNMDVEVAFGVPDKLVQWN